MVPSHLDPVVAAGVLQDPSEDPAKIERQPRINLLLAARISVPGDSSHDVKVRNLSASGARIDMPAPPKRGTTLLLCRGAVQVAAEVVWSGESGCGLRFSEPIDVASWKSGRPGAVAAAATHEPSLADDLGLARQLVERLEDALASRPEVVAALGMELIGIDLLAQLLRTSEKRAVGSTAPAIRSLWQAIGTFLRQPLS